jgi:hypothetical protein
MKVVQLNKLAFAFVWNIFIVILILSFPEILPGISSYAQTANKVRIIRSEFVPEAGCPVSVAGLRTELDLDPFDAPLDARIYVDYKNIGQKPIAAVKFRLRFTDNSGNDVGTFQASDGAMLAPDQESSQKFREEKIDPLSSGLKLRVLLVKYGDGQLWQSTKAPSSPAP